MTSTAASSRDTAASTVVGCRSVTSSTWPPSAQAVTVPPSKPSTNASSPPTKNPRSSSWTMRRQLCDEHVAAENQAAHLEDAMLRRLSKRRQMRLEADIRLLDKRLAEMVAANVALAQRYELLTRSCCAMAVQPRARSRSLIGEKTGIETVTYSLAKRKGVTHKSLVRDVKRDANYFKHADRDARDVLRFNEGKVYGVLQIACHDFGLIAGGMPIEAQIYEVWVTALAFRRISNAPLRKQELLRKCLQYFPGLRSADRAEQKRIGLRTMQQCLTDPSLEMKFNRVVGSGVV